MEELDRQVRRAQGRLVLQRFVGAAGWCCFAALVVALAGIIAGRIWPLGISPWMWLSGAIGLGLLTAAGFCLARWHSPLEAAIEIDHRFELKERLSSTLAMRPDELRTEVGRALAEDAAGRVARLDVPDRFRVRFGRQIWFPLLPAVLAGVVVWQFDAAGTENTAEATPEAITADPQVRQASRMLRKRMGQGRLLAEEKGLEEVEALLTMLEEETAKLSKADVDRKQGLVKLKNLARQIQQKREEAGGAEKLKEYLNRLRSPKKGPADDLAKAIRQGDFNRAVESLNKLKEKLEKSGLDDEQRKKLAEQLQQLREQLEKMAQAQETAAEDLQQQIDQLKEQGQSEAASALEQQLAKLRDQLPQNDQLSDLAEQLGQCAECLAGGSPEEAAAAMDRLTSGMQDLQAQLEELDLLDGAMAELAQGRNQMTCGQCDGEGCGACQGGFGSGDGEEGLPGFGLGRGSGQGPRGEEEHETSTIPIRAPQRPGPGGATISGTAGTASVRGSVEERIKERLEAAGRESSDPLAERRIPRKYQEHAREYLDRVRRGE